MSTWVQATPFGDIAVTLGPQGVERIYVPGLDRDFVAVGVEARDRATTKSRREAAIARELDEYFAGRRTHFDAPVDLSDQWSEFQRRVLLTLRDEVGYGETVTYGELAEMSGRPGAARAVGSTMARNPVPFLIPCHRVVAANGIGGYGGGFGDTIAFKRALLNLEAGGRSRY